MAESYDPDEDLSDDELLAAWDRATPVPMVVDCDHEWRKVRADDPLSTVHICVRCKAIVQRLAGRWVNLTDFMAE